MERDSLASFPGKTKGSMRCLKVFNGTFVACFLEVFRTKIGLHLLKMGFGSLG